MRLTRNNDDPRVLDDLEHLVRQFGPEDRQPQPLASETRSPVGTTDDVAVGESDPLADPFVERFVQVAVHVKRYAPFYAGAFAFFLALVLIQPVGSDREAVASDLALGQQQQGQVIANTDQSLTTTEPDASASPIFDSLGGSSATSFGAAFNSDAEAEFGSSPIARDEPSSAPSDSDTFTFPDTEVASTDTDDGPQPLQILASGYASTTGETPLEQAPANNALPVSATGGNETKRSFIRLKGTETTFRLKLDPAATHVQAETAVVKACPITTEGWAPKRGQAMASAPKASSGPCATGVFETGGTFVFDLADFGPVSATNGFALVMGPGTAQTFSVAFLPVTVPAPSPAEG